jgi:hypothetical protein
MEFANMKSISTIDSGRINKSREINKQDKPD